MRYLIDTNIFLFVVQEKDKLSMDVQYILNDYENIIYLSSESIKELILLLKAGRIEVYGWKTTKDIFASVEEWGFTVDYIKKEHFLTLGDIEPTEDTPSASQPPLSLRQRGIAYIVAKKLNVNKRNYVWNSPLTKGVPNLDGEAGYPAVTHARAREIVNLPLGKMMFAPPPPM